MKRLAMKYVVLIALISFFLGGLFFVNQQSGTADLIKTASQTSVAAAASTGGSMSVADIVKKVGPAVVYIEVNESSADYRGGRGFFGWSVPGQQQETTGTGTGFIINSNGYILTNQHVIDNADSITVKLENSDKSYEARVVGQDYDLDLAVLKINASNLPTIPMGDSDSMLPGDPVIAIGNPLGLDHTVTTGVISAKGRPITIEDRNYKNLIQTDAAINPGNSGGPLINMQGQVIAINTAVSSDGQGIGFAIPINTAKSILQDLINDGKVVRPYLGVSMVDLTSDVAEQMNIDPDTKGVLIAQVVSDSPADQAGIKDMDILVSIDGKTMSNSSQVQDYIRQKQVGDKVKLGLLRDGRSLSVSVTLKEKPE